MAPGVSAPRLPRRAGVRPLPSATGASAPRLPRRAGARPPSTAPGARGPRYSYGPEPATPSHSKGPSPRHSAHGPRPTALASTGTAVPQSRLTGRARTIRSKGSLPRFKLRAGPGHTIRTRAGPPPHRQSPAALATALRQVGAGIMDRTSAAGPIVPVLTVIVIRSGRTSLIRNNRDEG